MTKTSKLTVTLPEDLISFADRMAKKKKISRSKVVSLCIQEMAESQRIAEMAEGYQIMAKEQKQIVDAASEIEHEVIPEWR